MVGINMKSRSRYRRCSSIFYTLSGLVLLALAAPLHAIELAVTIESDTGSSTATQGVLVEVFHRDPAQPNKLRRGNKIGQALTNSTGTIRFGSPQFQIGEQVVLQVSKRIEMPNQFRFQIPESDENWPQHFQAANHIFTTIRQNTNPVRIIVHTENVANRIQYPLHTSISGRVLVSDGDRFPRDWYGAHSNSAVQIELEQLNRNGRPSGRIRRITTQHTYDFGEVPGGWVYTLKLLGSAEAGMRGHVPREMIWHPTEVVTTLNGISLRRNPVADANFLMLSADDYTNSYRLAATQLFFSGTENYGVSFLGARIVSGSSETNSLFVADRYATVNGLGYAMAAIQTYGTLDIGFFAGGRCDFSPENFWVEDPDLSHVMPECAGSFTSRCANTIAVSNCRINTDDFDADGINDDDDNCPFTPNPDQADSNGNGIGDACDPDDNQEDDDRDNDDETNDDNEDNRDDDSTDNEDETDGTNEDNQNDDSSDNEDESDGSNTDNTDTGEDNQNEDSNNNETDDSSEENQDEENSDTEDENSDTGDNDEQSDDGSDSIDFCMPDRTCPGPGWLPTPSPTPVGTPGGNATPWPTPVGPPVSMPTPTTGPTPVGPPVSMPTPTTGPTPDGPPVSMPTPTANPDPTITPIDMPTPTITPVDPPSTMIPTPVPTATSGYKDRALEIFDLINSNREADSNTTTYQNLRNTIKDFIRRFLR